LAEGQGEAASALPQGVKRVELMPWIAMPVRARPFYGYRRITAILNRQLRSEDLAPVNHK